MEMVRSFANATHCVNSFKDAGVCSLGLMQVGMVSEEARLLFQWVVYAALLTTISSFGTVANIINIICFVRQGLKDPVNVSLLGLAISDFGILLTSLLIGIGYNPALLKLDLPFEIVDLQYAVTAWPYVIFTGASSWLTALITLERCLCIMKPLKVKSMITPLRINFAIVSVFILITTSVAPMYYVGRLTWVFSPEKNRTLLQLIYTKDREMVEQISVAFNSVFIPFSAYLTIIICTVILVFKLRSKAKWRRTCTAPSSGDITSTDRDQKISKMVIAVSSLFIVCFSPICLSILTVFVVPELAMDGPNQNVLFVIVGVSMLLQNANSSANIFIYYNMSTRYRTVCQNLLCLG